MSRETLSILMQRSQRVNRQFSTSSLKERLRTIRTHIDQVFFFSSFEDYSSTIMEGKEFRKTKEAFIEKQKELTKEGEGNKPNAARIL